MKVFVLDPQTWLRGDPDNSQLLRESDGLMCCQGQRCLMLGVEKYWLVGIYNIGDIECIKPSELNDSIDYVAYKPNDRVGLGDEERVKDINESLALVKADYRFALPSEGHPAMTVYEVGEDV